MAWRALSAGEIEELLCAQRIVRVAFATPEERYVVPLGYVWTHSALWGTTRRGRKTELAAIDSRVAFSIDDSATSTAFQWRSCLGEGAFELVELDEFRASAAIPLSKAFPDNPQWNQREWVDGLRDGTSVCWRIRPGTLAGRAHQEP